MKSLLILLWTLLAFPVWGQVDIPSMDSGAMGGGQLIQTLTFPEEYGTVDDFIKKNLVYPEVAKEKKLNDAVFVLFSMDEAGKIIDFRIGLPARDPSFEKEIVRLVKLMPIWAQHPDYGKFGVPGRETRTYTFNFIVPK